MVAKQVRYQIEPTRSRSKSGSKRVRNRCQSTPPKLYSSKKFGSTIRCTIGCTISRTTSTPERDPKLDETEYPKYSDETRLVTLCPVRSWMSAEPEQEPEGLSERQELLIEEWLYYTVQLINRNRELEVCETALEELPPWRVLEIGESVERQRTWQRLAERLVESRRAALVIHTWIQYRR